MIRHIIIFFIMRYFISRWHKETNKRKRKPLVLTSFLKGLNYTVQHSDQLRFHSSLAFPLFAIYPRLPFSFRFPPPLSPFIPRSLPLVPVPLSFSLCVSSSLCSPSILPIVSHPSSYRTPLKDAATRSGYRDRTENRRSFVKSKETRNDHRVESNEWVNPFRPLNDC